MKIIFDNGGQTCNKLWSYIPILKNCIENDSHAYILSYIPELEQFPDLKNNKYFKYPLYISNLSYRSQVRYTQLISRIFRNKYWDIISPLTRSFNNIFWDPWYNGIDDEPNELILKSIKKLLYPSQKIMKDIEHDFEKWYGQIIIGVHIRRGDYKYWHDGKYYFSLEEYAKCCESVCNFLNKKPVFLICSNEKISLQHFKDFTVFQLSKKSSIHDLYALSKCDYIIGPPSTFSAWASFIGEKPHSFIYNPKIFDPNFRIIKSHSRYTNGEKVIYHPQ